VRDTVEQLRRPIPDAVWDELRAEGLLAPGVPVPAGPPDAEGT
jgi:D-threo-aldose 1-dehydrogenase